MYAVPPKYSITSLPSLKGFMPFLALLSICMDAIRLEATETIYLESGDYLVVDPSYDLPGPTTIADVGAVFYHEGGTGALLGTLNGSTANDQVGSGGITLFGSGASAGFVVRSPQWDNGTATDAGAVTMGGNPGYFGPFGGVVSATNSLVGSSANDQVGSGGITLFGSGASAGFVVRSPQWDNGTATDAGAVTMGGNPGYFGPFGGVVSATNSLVGSSANDQVGSGGVTLISDGGLEGFLVHSPMWDHRTATNAGAVTMGGFPGYFAPFGGVVSATNSIVGSHSNDQIGSGGLALQGSPSAIHLLSPNWCYGAGAATPVQLPPLPWSGVVSAANSIVGAENAEPEIALFQAPLIELASGGILDFGGVAESTTLSISLVIKNNGTDDLLLTGTPRVVLSGADAALFSIGTQPPALIVAGDSATVTVDFTPNSSGQKAAQLTISNNDGNENPYSINLSGIMLLPIANWRQAYFASSANSGPGADDADFDHDGIPNLLEYSFGLNPTQNTAGQLPQPALSSGNFGVSFNHPAQVNGITYGAEWSTSLSPSSWQPVTDTGVPPQHIFSVPVAGNARMFMRLKVSPAP
ncbi:MAG: choice-of-anchor D domain-containing protein [Verrucomicrobiaceae bacterium]|nr:choice-of-anchor D domain-containing protein [Verrucomicrobiaceae bacterium]